MVTGVLHQLLPMAQIRSQRHYFSTGPKTPAQQPEAVQLLQPLAILYIALAPRYVLDMARVNQHHLKTALFENLVQRYPVNTRRLHRHRLNPTQAQPIG